MLLFSYPTYIHAAKWKREKVMPGHHKALQRAVEVSHQLNLLNPDNFRFLEPNSINFYIFIFRK